MMLGSLSDTAMSSMRPPMLAGPIERKRNGASSGSLEAFSIGRDAGMGAGACAVSLPRAGRLASAAKPIPRRDKERGIGDILVGVRATRECTPDRAVRLRIGSPGLRARPGAGPDRAA